jgi:hypothetical protein
MVKLTLPLAKPSMPSATRNRSKTEGAWQLAGNLKMLGMAIHRDTWNNTSNQCSIFPLLVISPIMNVRATTLQNSAGRHIEARGED